MYGSVVARELAYALLLGAVMSSLSALGVVYVSQLDECSFIWWDEVGSAERPYSACIARLESLGFERYAVFPFGDGRQIGSGEVFIRQSETGTEPHATYPRYGSIARMMSRRDVRGPSEVEPRLQDGVGFPWIAFWCEYEFEREQATFGLNTDVPGNWRIVGARWKSLLSLGGLSITRHQSAYEDGLRHIRALPLRPAWLGLIGNVLVYGCAIRALIVISRGARSFLRGLYGRCACCGFDLRGLPDGMRCPECGAINVTSAETHKSA